MKISLYIILALFYQNRLVNREEDAFLKTFKMAATFIVSMATNIFFFMVVGSRKRPIL